MTAPQGPQHRKPGIRISVNQIIGVVVLVVLIVFIFSNRDTQPISFLGWTAHIPIWIALLGTACIGAAIGAGAVSLAARKRGKAAPKK